MGSNRALCTIEEVEQLARQRKSIVSPWSQKPIPAAVAMNWSAAMLLNLLRTRSMTEYTPKSKRASEAAGE